MAQIGTPAAGWYADPSGHYRARYWDGTSWTDQVRDDLGESAAPAATAPRADQMAETVVGVAEAVAVVAAAGSFAGARGPAAATPMQHAGSEPTATLAGLPGGPGPGWYPDPTQRHQARWWDGAQWTERVVADGVERVDPLPQAPPDARGATSPGVAEAQDRDWWVVADDPVASDSLSPGQASLAALAAIEDQAPDVARSLVRPSAKVRTAGGFVFAGAVALLAGSATAWMQVRGPRVNDSWTATGLDLGDGRITIALAMLLAVLGAGLATGRLARIGGAKVGAMGSLVAGAASLAVAAVDIADVADRASRLGVPAGAVSDVGNGLWLAFIGSLFAVGGGLMAFANRQ
jgi:hypothetical protein